MTEPLSPDQLDLLLPVLRHVAEMVQKGADLNRDDLQLLLLPSGLDEEWATGELERWVKVLVAVRGVTDPGKRELAQRALMLRGLPEAPVLLAVDTVAGGGGVKPPPDRRLTASVERLDFGALPPGQGAATEFEVQGGPGQVVVDSDQVRVTPQQFGAEPTRLRVEVKPLASGVLWTTLRLVTAGETLELPLVAQWQEQVSAPPIISSANAYRVAQARCLGEESVKVRSVAISPDGKILASGSENAIQLWSIHTGRRLRTLIGHSNAVESVAFSPDGRMLASGSYDGTVKLWDVSTGWELYNFGEHKSWVWTVAFSTDGRILASGGSDNMVRLWDCAQGCQLRTIPLPADVESVTFSPDGRIIASGSDDCLVRLWDVSTGRELHTFKGHTMWVRSVAFSPNGRILASAGRDSRIILWEVSTGRDLYNLTQHTEQVRSVAFSPNGTVLASGSQDKTIMLWEVSAGRVLRALNGHTADILSVSFSSDGCYLASGSLDCTVRLWTVFHIP